MKNVSRHGQGGKIASGCEPARVQHHLFAMHIDDNKYLFHIGKLENNLLGIQPFKLSGSIFKSTQQFWRAYSFYGEVVTGESFLETRRRKCTISTFQHSRASKEQPQTECGSVHVVVAWNVFLVNQRITLSKSLFIELPGLSKKVSMNRN